METEPMGMGPAASHHVSGEVAVGQHVGHIRVERFLARGGMGALYVGFDEKLERRVALRHGIAERIAHVLAAAHAAGVVHRDLNPANVMLASDGQVKVLDFGLSRFVERGERRPAHEPAGSLPAVAPDGVERRQLETVQCAPPGMASTVGGPTGGELETQHGSVLGTLEFMSPEQARGELAGPASDSYSFGLLLQLVFTGRSATASGSPPLLHLQRASRGESLPVTGVDPDLAALIGRMKSLAPSARPSAVDVAERLDWIRRKPGRRLRRLATAGTIVAALDPGLRQPGRV